MKKFIYIAAALIFLAGFIRAADAAQPAISTFAGGTGSTSPSGIVYGDGSIGLKTVVPGANCTFSGGVFNCTGGGGSGSGTVSTSTALVSGQVDFSTSASTIANDATFLFDSTLKKLTVNNASTTALSIAGSTYLTNLSAGTANIGAGGVVYSTATSTPSLPSYITYSGTLGSFIGGASGSLAISQLPIANGGTGSTTAPVGQLLYGGAAAYQSVATSSLGVSGPIGLTGTAGALVGGTNLTITCASCNTSNATVSSVGLSSTNSTLTIGSTPVTTSGTITADLNLAHGNSWTALQTFTLASSSLLSAGKAYFGLTATTTIDGSGNLVLPSAANLTITGKSDGCATFASGQLNSTGVACGSGSGGGGTGLASTTAFGAWTGGNVAVVYSNGAVYGQATSSITFSGPFNGFSALGALVGGSNSTVSYYGLATTSQPTAGNLIMSNGGSGVSGVATTSITCSGNISCTGFTGLGSASAITLTGTISIANGGTGTTTVPVGQLLYGGAAAYQSVATSSLGVSAPITYSGTLGAQVGGTGGSFGCTSASAGVTGCLTGTDWSTFNAKQAGGFQISTTSSIGISKVAYFTGATPTSLGGVATTSVAAGTGLTGTLTTLGSGDAVALSIPVSIANGGSNTTSQTSNGVNFFNGTSITSGTGLTFTGTNFGIGSTSPYRSLGVQGSGFSFADQFGTEVFTLATASTTGPIFAIEATTTGNAILWSEDQYGHLTASSTGAAPTISSCGTGSPAMGTNANDAVGSFLTGTSASGCTITFAHAYSSTPIVVISDSNTTAVIDVSAISTTAFTVSMASALSAVTVYYQVIMP